MTNMVLISGGDLKTNDKINKFALSLTKKTNPCVLFIPTASNDAPGYIETIKNYYTNLSCSVDSLNLLNINKYEAISKEVEKINKADLIYIGGGSTEELLRVWEKYNISEKILEANQKGTVITGISAGLNCWFKYSHSDSDYFKDSSNWQYKFVKGLDVFPFYVCPHYNEEGRDTFDEMLKNANSSVDGYALDNDTAVYVREDTIKFCRSDKNSYVYYFKNINRVYEKQQVTDYIEQ